MRIEPPPSLACANGTMPLATAAAEPPLDPPGERAGVPRVVRRPPGDRFGGRHAAEFGAVGPAGDHQAGLAEPAHQCGVGRRDHSLVLEREVAVGDALTGVAGKQIFDQERHAAKRTVGQRSSGGVTRVVEPADHHRIEGGIDALDPLDGRFEQFERRHLTVAHQGGLVDRIHPAGLIGE